jgi:uncharacterized protein YecE (DUF72 family)
MKNWLIGCSGFSYKHWKGRFYPKDVPQKKWFEYYCQHFNTVELNVTFYRVPKPAVFKSWYERSPNNFRFTVKAPRLITHYKKFKNITDEITRFYDIVSENLEDKLGSVLFQLHPRFEYSEENLELLLDHMDPAFTNVIEFRHASWWRENVYKALRKRQITFCSISYPGLPDDVVKTAPVVYYRFHGVPQLYLSSYSTQTLADVTAQIRALRGVNDVYIYFNNDIDVHAIHNARVVQTLVNSKSLPKEKLEQALH